MKRLISALTIVLLIIFPSISFSAYRIDLKNGYSFVTESYWEESGLIKIIRYGGVIGLDQSLISGIYWTDEEPEGSKDQKNQTVKTTILKPGEKMTGNSEDGLKELNRLQPPSL
ncbi:MAG: hypothetical protein K9L30_02755 [Desulfobacterales bacterium]|nr:hypothetical protein [Desulfobacterales bacterium]